LFTMKLVIISLSNSTALNSVLLKYNIIHTYRYEICLLPLFISSLCTVQTSGNIDVSEYKWQMKTFTKSVTIVIKQTVRLSGCLQKGKEHRHERFSRQSDIKVSNVFCPKLNFLNGLPCGLVVWHTQISNFSTNCIFLLSTIALRTKWFSESYLFWFTRPDRSVVP